MVSEKTRTRDAAHVIVAGGPFGVAFHSKTRMDLTKKERQVLDSQREIDWLKRQIQQYEYALDAPSDTSQTVPDTPSEEDLLRYKERVDGLRNQLDVIAQFNLSKDCMTRNLDASHFTRCALYPIDADYNQLKRSQQVEDAVNERDQLVIEFMQLLDQLQKVKIKLAHTQRQITETHLENRELTQSLRQLNEDELNDRTSAVSLTSSQDADGLADRMHEMRDRLEIARNVLIGLILESNIDYVDDEYWSGVMQRIGNELD
ncbi:hypothetical protein DFQ28_001506 [Apophysomyces sp. BC1034]|nr:hypothetical protein DFQ30_010856 [Apophysomyces sp. BC1015]KAG0180270.1 hypothetical protein DFQ29_000967 [Apophysomyces sp. BC1021]KAG0190809.1 hypothetical protein DFQ28_001506 [Apophysomyces sp. BC1034]